MQGEMIRFCHGHCIIQPFQFRICPPPCTGTRTRRQFGSWENGMFAFFPAIRIKLIVRNVTQSIQPRPEKRATAVSPIFPIMMGEQIARKIMCRVVPQKAMTM